MKLEPKLAVWAAAAIPANAGDPSVVVEGAGAAAAPVAVHDWSGPYAGLSYGKTAADITFASGTNVELDDGDALGIYGGYLVQRGQLVYGGELSYAAVGGAKLENGSGNDEWIKHVLDIKARVGFAANRSLFYAVLGYSSANLIDEVAPIQESKLNGFSVGLGAEFAVNERLHVGLEYLSRDLSGDYAFGGGNNIDVGLDTLTLRVGFAF